MGISFPTACRKLRKFKEDYLADFMWKVNCENQTPVDNCGISLSRRREKSRDTETIGCAMGCQYVKFYGSHSMHNDIN